MKKNNEDVFIIKDNENKFFLLKIVLIIINIICSILLMVGITKLNILPTKYYILMIVALVALNAFISLLVLLKNKVTVIIGVVLSSFLITGSIIGNVYIGKTNSFLNEAFGNIEYEVFTYNLYVLKDSSLTSVNELNNKNVGYLKDYQESVAKLKDENSINPVLFEDAFKMYDELINKNVDSILLDETYIGILQEFYSDVEDKIRVIDSVEVKVEVEPAPEEKNNSNLRPINVFISVSDSRKGVVNTGRSDADMIMTINPKTHEILLTSIPRDYYVTVHGRPNEKGKLTHVGLYGLSTTTKTVEDLMGIKIDYSVKVGFQGIISVIDLVGGIDIYSDIEYVAVHMPELTVRKGNNHFNGAQAVAFARERKAYEMGDRTRVKNEQLVLETTLKKLMKNKKLLLEYEKVLANLKDLYRTDIPRDLITEFIKEQLDTMQGWKFTNQQLGGKGEFRTDTFSAPGKKMYVVPPDQDSIKRCRSKINSMLNK